MFSYCVPLSPIGWIDIRLIIIHNLLPVCVFIKIKPGEALFYITAPFGAYITGLRKFSYEVQFSGRDHRDHVSPKNSQFQIAHIEIALSIMIVHFR